MQQVSARIFILILALLFSAESIGMAIYKNHCPKSGKTSTSFFFNSCCCNKEKPASCCDVELAFVKHQSDCFSQLKTPHFPDQLPGLIKKGALYVAMNLQLLVKRMDYYSPSFISDIPPPSGKNILIRNQVFIL